MKIWLYQIAGIFILLLSGRAYAQTGTPDINAYPIDSIILGKMKQSGIVGIGAVSILKYRSC